MTTVWITVAFVVWMLVGHEYRKWREDRCDACRLDAMNTSDMNVWIPHTCSKRHGFYKDKAGHVLEFGKDVHGLSQYH